MATSRLTNEQLDAILALQFSVAWAGENAGDPPRLAWWKTDLVDREGGGDLFARLAPRTGAWAGLSLVRAAAREVDRTARTTLARGDEIWTPFHFGFFVDEQLDERIAHHRGREHVPAEVLGPTFLPHRAWSRSTFETTLQGLGTPKVTTSPAGRQIALRSGSAADAAPLLFAALLPLSSSYPLPFIEVGA